MINKDPEVIDESPSMVSNAQKKEICKGYRMDCDWAGIQGPCIGWGLEIVYTLMKAPSLV